MPTDGIVGSPYLYYLALKGALQPSETYPTLPHSLSSQTTIDVLLIPDHNTRHEMNHIDHAGFIQRSLDRMGSPRNLRFLAMIHPQDALDQQIVNLYSERGIPTWTNPRPMHSARFLDALTHVLCSTDAVLAQSLQTALWYAAYLGRTTVLDSPENFLSSAWFSRESSLGSSITDALVKSSDVGAWQAAAADELGRHQMLAPDQMRRLLTPGWLTDGTGLNGPMNVARSAVLSTTVGMAAKKLLTTRGSR